VQKEEKLKRMYLKSISYKPIGVIYTPFKSSKGTPIQPKSAEETKGRIVVNKEYIEGLKDLEGFSHIILVFHFHLVRGYSSLVKPYMDNNFHGVFATRAPKRPNPIGISVVRLLRIRRNILYIRDVDIVDGTPLLDIKPYVPEFDIRKVDKIGWLERRVHRLKDTKDDGRFIKDNE